ncbi:energy transducer TonB [bacterium]|nr:energy transducer TonB [bacterium]
MNKITIQISIILLAISQSSCTPPAEIVSYSELDEGFVAIYSPFPNYPPDARLQGEEGTVIIKALVGTDGKVNKVEISQSSGYSSLDSAARDAAGEWEFTEPTRNGEPVRVWVLLSFNFRLT